MKRREPSKRISIRALKVWRLYGWINTGILTILAIGAILLTGIFDFPSWIYWAAAAIPVVYGVFFIWIIPKLRWKRWRYEVREDEIEMQYGIIVVKRTLVPMVRVQHVDTAQGPILRRHRLSTISISTAATVHEIPALDVDEADELRDSISALARVAEDDV